MADTNYKKLMDAVERLTGSTDRDVLVFSGGIDERSSETFINQLVTYKQRRRKATLFLCTYGGDPHSAYRMTRVLRRCYPDDVRILIGGYCKSAGTLVALSADSLGFSEVGELGPLDTQISERDEVLQMASGLEVFSTLQYLTDHAFACFEKNMLALVRKSGQTISTRLASEISTNLATGLLNPITAQLDPNRIGIAQRGLEVTKDYGRRLANKKNLVRDAASIVHHLVNDYPTHAFVIDQEEAKTLFTNVDSFSDDENAVYEQLREQLTVPTDDDGLIVNLSATLTFQEESNASTDEASRETSSDNPGDAGSARKGTKSDTKSSGKSKSAESNLTEITANIA